MKKMICSLVGILCFCICYSRSPFDPSDSTAYSGPTSFCQGGSLALSANYAPANSSFQWQVSTDNGLNYSLIPGATNPSYTATSTGLYSVLVTTAGNTIAWPAVAVTVHPNPVANFSFNPNNQ